MKRQLRGDYSKAAADYAVEQDWSAYTAEDHALYRRLFERQATLVPRYAHDFFGHVPLLFDRTYADHLYEYGKAGRKAMRLGAVKLLARLSASTTRGRSACRSTWSASCAATIRSTASRRATTSSTPSPS